MGPQIWEVKKFEKSESSFCPMGCIGQMPEQSQLLGTGDGGFPKGGRDLYCKRLRKRLSLRGGK